MDHIQWFHLLVTILCFLQGVWWSRRGWANVIVKLIFWTFAVWGIIVALQDRGMIVQM